MSITKELTEKSKELVREAIAHLHLLPDPYMKLHNDHGTEVFAGVDIEVLDNGIQGKVLVRIANFEFDDCAGIDDIRAIYDERISVLSEDEIFDGEFLKEAGARNAEFFAGAPEMIRKLVIALKEATE